MSSVEGPPSAVEVVLRAQRLGPRDQLLLDRGVREALPLVHLAQLVQPRRDAAERGLQRSSEAVPLAVADAGWRGRIDRRYADRAPAGRPRAASDLRRPRGSARARSAARCAAPAGGQRVPRRPGAPRRAVRRLLCASTKRCVIDGIEIRRPCRRATSTRRTTCFHASSSTGSVDAMRSASCDSASSRSRVCVIA